MKAYHMPSLPEIPLGHHNEDISETKQMQLKVLYSIEDNNFLARSSIFHPVKTARVVIPGNSNLITLGAIPIKDVIVPIYNSSPELFSDISIDHSIYVKDVSEEDEPFVGHGLVSKIFGINNNADEVLVPGRVCSNFTSLLGNKGTSETLEIKVKLIKVKKQISITKEESQSHSQSQQNHQQNQPSQLQTQRQQQLKVLPTMINHSQDDFKEKSNKRQPRKNNVQSQSSTTTRRSSNSYIQPQPKNNKRPYQNDDKNDGFLHPQQPVVNTTTTSNQRRLNNLPAQKAVRTQSLPVFQQNIQQLPKSIVSNYPPDSIAKKIYLADKYNSSMNNSQKISIHTDQEISERFPNFQKITSSNTTFNNLQLPPTGTFAHGSNSVTSTKKRQTLKPKPTIPKPVDEKITPSCINCKTTDNNNWRWNQAEDQLQTGLMCYNCYVYLREKGEMKPTKIAFSNSNPKKNKKPVENNINTSSSSSSSSPISGLTPVDDKNKLQQANPLTNDPYLNSSDSINEFQGIMNHSDLDFQLGPLTDIDPLPTKAEFRYPNLKANNNKVDNKENLPPSNAVPLKKYSDQSAFEKMLVRSFSGFPTASNGSPSEWMTDLFQDVPNQTPKDTPRIDNTPRDITTCNTLPCAEESPDNDKPEIDDSNLKQNNDNIETNQPTKGKILKAIPSSPFVIPEVDEDGSPKSRNSMNDNSDDWRASDLTKLSSDTNINNHGKLIEQDEQAGATSNNYYISQ